MVNFFQNAWTLSLKSIGHMLSLNDLFSHSAPAPPSAAEQLLVDTHAHWLPGVDDGAATEEEGLTMVRGLADLGFQKLIATPHIMIDRYQNGPEKLTEIFDAFRQSVARAGIPVSLHLAAEYMLDEGFLKQLEAGPLLTLKDQLVLVEMPRFQAPPGLSEILFELQLRSYIPVLAHPERYFFLQKKPAGYEKLKAAGCLFQVNLLSALGFYGEKEAESALFLLKKGWCELAGTDVHRTRQIKHLKRVSLSGSFKNKDLF